MLQIAIHGQDELTRSVVKTGSQRRSLAEVATQLHHQHPAIYGRDFFQQFVGAVVGPIVHQHQLKLLAHLFHHLFQASVENGYVLFFVVKWHNY